MSIQFLSRGPLAQISGGYLYNRYLIEHLHRAGAKVTYHAEPPDLKKFNQSDTIIVDSLVLGHLADRLLATPARLLLLLHVVPRLRGSSDHLKALCERAELVVTGEPTLNAVRTQLQNGRSAIKISPGVPEHWQTKSRYASTAQRLLCVANYLPEKGIDRVINALTELRSLSWTLTVLGNRAFDPSYYDRIARLVRQRGLSDRIDLSGAVSHGVVNTTMVASDLLVHLSCHESYSMVTAEAIASGLPVLSYRTGECESFRRSGLVRYVDDDGSSDVDALAQLISENAAYGELRRSEGWRVRTCQDVGREFIDYLVGQ